MKSNTHHWKTADGIEIFAKSWEPDNGEIKGVINLVHGMGEHIERYDHVAEALTAKGYAVFGADHRGHGKSGGNRGHIPGYDTILDDVELLLKKSAERYPGKPAFIYGHSMGGGVVANLLVRRRPAVKAALLSAPYFRLSVPQPKLKLMLGRMTQNLLPKLTLPTGLNADHISRDKQVVEKYKNDPLVHDKISAMMGISIVDAGEYAIAHASQVKVPTLVLHGTGDQLTSSDGSIAFSKNAGSEVEIRLYDQLYHEIHNEPEKEKVFADIVAWFDKYI